MPIVNIFIRYNKWNDVDRQILSVFIEEEKREKKIKTIYHRRGLFDNNRSRKNSSE